MGQSHAMGQHGIQQYPQSGQASTAKSPGMAQTAPQIGHMGAPMGAPMNSQMGVSMGAQAGVPSGGQGPQTALGVPMSQPIGGAQRPQQPQAPVSQPAPKPQPTKRFAIVDPRTKVALDASAIGGSGGEKAETEEKSESATPLAVVEKEDVRTGCGVAIRKDVPHQFSFDHEHGQWLSVVMHIEFFFGSLSRILNQICSSSCVPLVPRSHQVFGRIFSDTSFDHVLPESESRVKLLGHDLTSFVERSTGHQSA